jgi:hypothetical protein
MQILKDKSKISAIAVVLILSFAATFVALPIVSAHDPPMDIPTWAYISITTDVIGVGQQVVIIYWPNALPPTADGAYGDRWTWNVEVTKPDGSIEMLGPYTSDPVGGGYAVYTPSEVGTYTIVAIMDDHLVTGEPMPPGGFSPYSTGGVAINDTYIGDTSDPVTLTVQEEPIEGWQESPLPEEYWTRPINTMNRDWWQVAGNWLGSAWQTNGPTTNFAYGLGPESAHVMWTRPIWTGGIMDERFGVTGYQTYHYEGLRFTPPIILDGKLFYNVETLPKYGWYCVDLYTGETIYFHNTTGPVTNIDGGGFDPSGEISTGKLAFGQIYNYESPNQHGGMSYLWSTPPISMFGGAPTPGAQTDWMMFDAFTGNYICSIANVPSWVGLGEWGAFMGGGKDVYGKDGSITSYAIVGSPNPMGPFFPSVPPFYLQVWNSSRAIWYEEEFISNTYWMWRPVLNMTYDGNNGYSLNVSIPAVSGSILAVREGEFIIGGTSGTNKVDTPLELGNLWCLSLEDGQEGTLLWNRTFTPPYDEISPTIGGGMFGGGGVSMGTVDPEDGVVLFSNSITRERWGLNIETGEIWGPTDPEPALNYYGMSANIYEGKLLTCGYGGELIAYNITTGEKLWTYKAAQEGFESPYGNYPMGIGCIADGKIYIGAGEHSPSQPLWRGSVLRCINATDGAELWKIPIFGVSMPSGNGGDNFAIADGYLLALNAYDNQIYCIGKGPSATTVTAPDMGIPLGSSVVIRGTVTDQCAGAKRLVEEGKFNIVPAIADEYQTDFMEYLYMQQPCPKDVDGVEVVLETLDPNNNFYEIGTVTSDASGMFKLLWEPPVPGEYTIIATFEGSAAYYGSSAETAIGVTEAPSPAQPIEPEPTAPVPTEPAPTEPVPTEPAPTEPEPTQPAPTEPEPTEPTEAPLFSTTDLAIIAAVAVAVIIGIAAYWALRKRK